MEELKVDTGTVKSFFIRIGSLDRIYDSERDLALFLWRAARSDQETENPLYPDFVSREIRKGKFRSPDVTIENRDGIEFITPKIYKKRQEDIWKVQGTSLFDRPNTFLGNKWEYIEIPKGTEIPKGILILKDDFNDRFEATHYSIVPDHCMPLKNFKVLLNNLLKNINAQREKLKYA